LELITDYSKANYGWGGFQGENFGNEGQAEPSLAKPGKNPRRLEDKLLKPHMRSSPQFFNER
jgi:hypothetical protein